jgi:signal peptidase II
MRIKYYIATLLVLAFDLVAKLVVRGSLAGGRVIEIVPGYLRFSYVGNSGVAFGLFDGVQSFWKPYILAGMAVIALAAIIIYSVRMPRDRILLQTALAITMGGILGNFVDRIIRGYVIDFIEFHIHDSFYWPNFNVADSAITIGIALLLLDTIMNPAMKEAAEQ